MKLRITDYIVAICFWILWDKIVAKVILGFLLNLKFIPPNISYVIVFFLPFVLLYELVAKLLMLQTIPDKPKFVPIQLEEIPEVDRTNLDAYTISLESLGFVKLIDIKVSESSLLVIRVFSHPEYLCFAEVNQVVGRIPINCIIDSVLEKNWTVSFSNRELNLLAATNYAFSRCPKNLLIYKPNLYSKELVKAHLDFREKMMADLNLEVLPDVSLSAYYAYLQRVRRQQKKTLWYKSIIVAQIEKLLFSSKSEVQKLQWLGDYARIAARN